jgi:biopolymer transport protein ExbB
MRGMAAETALKAVEFGILGLLVALGLACLAIFIRRWRALDAVRKDAEPWIDGLSGDLSGKLSLNEAKPAAAGSAAERLVGIGLSNPHLCPEALERLLETQEAREREKLERGSQFLGTVGANAPFLGLTGTVIGILSAFSRMAADGAGGIQVMGAISRALVATAAGLMVAIPAVVLYNVLKSRIRKTMGILGEIRGLLMARSLQSVAKEAF